MAVVLSNEAVAEGIFRMRVKLPDNLFSAENAVSMAEPVPGQFYMVRAWDREPLLSRPISVHDYDNHVVTFLYQVVGRGTEIFSTLSPMEAIWLEGPFGNGFPVNEIPEDLTVVGGGIGTAPLYYVCKAFKAQYPNRKLKVYLGFSKEAYLVSEFEALADDMIVDVGGIITNQIEAKANETFFSCGPQVMMEALAKKIPEGNRVFLSLEARMACGLGACLGCGIDTVEGRKRVCKDGPVFAREVLQ